MAEQRRVIAVSDRESVVAAVRRLAAVAGVNLDVAGSAALRAAWRAADMLVIDGELSESVVDAALSRRAEVLVVVDGPADERQWRAGVAIGAAGVLALPDDEADLVERLVMGGEPAAAAGRVIAVRSGCGGAGASTFAAALATQVAHRMTTLLIDGDADGGGLDVLLGAEGVTGPRWPELATRSGPLPAEVLGMLPSVAGCALLSWDRRGPVEVGPAAMAAVLDAAVRRFSLVVVDLPRSPAPAATALEAAAELITIVVPTAVRAAAAAALAARTPAAETGLVARRVGSGSLTGQDLARSLGLELWATVPTDPAVAAAAERGEPPPSRRGALADACRTVSERVSGLQPPVVSAAPAGRHGRVAEPARPG